MKYLIAVATVAVALVLMAAPAQAQYCHNIVVGPFADNVLTPNEKSRHRFDSVTRPCADSNDNQMRAIWLNEGKSGAVAYAGDVRPLYNEREGVGLEFQQPGSGAFQMGLTTSGAQPPRLSRTRFQSSAGTSPTGRLTARSRACLQRCTPTRHTSGQPT